MIFEVKEVLTKQTIAEDVNKKAKRNRHPDVVSSCYLKLDSLNRWITGYTPGYYDEDVKELIDGSYKFVLTHKNGNVLDTKPFIKIKE